MEDHRNFKLVKIFPLAHVIDVLIFEQKLSKFKVKSTPHCFTSLYRTHAQCACVVVTNTHFQVFKYFGKYLVSDEYLNTV